MPLSDATWRDIVWRYVCKVAAPGGYFSIEDLKPYYPAMITQKQSRNRFIGEKVRQQLQILRDEGKITFLIPGSYKRA